MPRIGTRGRPTLGRYVVLSFGLAMVLYGALRWPSRALGGADAVRSLGCAVGIALVGTLLGRLAEALAIRKLRGSDAGFVHASMAGLGVRLFTTLGMILAVVTAEPFPLMAFGLQAGACYVSLLALEVFVNLRDFGQNPRDEGADASADRGQPSAGPDADSLPDDASGS